MNQFINTPNKLFKLFNTLEGTWQFHRVIDGDKNVHGKAVFIKTAANKLLYKEEGIYKPYIGNKFNVYREYLYTYNNNEISVFFVEGDQTRRLFHTLNPMVADTSVANYTFMQAIATHLCKQDKYDATYSFINEYEFTLQYKVTGPAKNHLIATYYFRLCTGKI